MRTRRLWRRPGGRVRRRALGTRRIRHRRIGPHDGLIRASRIEHERRSDPQEDRGRNGPRHPHSIFPARPANGGTSTRHALRGTERRTRGLQGGRGRRDDRRGERLFAEDRQRPDAAGASGEMIVQIGVSDSVRPQLLDGRAIRTGSAGGAKAFPDPDGKREILPAGRALLEVSVGRGRFAARPRQAKQRRPIQAAGLFRSGTRGHDFVPYSLSVRTPWVFVPDFPAQSRSLWRARESIGPMLFMGIPVSAAISEYDFSSA